MSHLEGVEGSDEHANPQRGAGHGDRSWGHLADSAPVLPRGNRSEAAATSISTECLDQGCRSPRAILSSISRQEAQEEPA